MNNQTCHSPRRRSLMLVQQARPSRPRLNLPPLSKTRHLWCAISSNALNPTIRPFRVLPAAKVTRHQTFLLQTYSRLPLALLTLQLYILQLLYGCRLLPPWRLIIRSDHLRPLCLCHFPWLRFQLQILRTLLPPSPQLSISPLLQTRLLPTQLWTPHSTLRWTALSTVLFQMQGRAKQNLQLWRLKLTKSDAMLKRRRRR